MYLQLKNNVSLRGHNVQGYDSEVNFVIFTTTTPIVHYFMNKHLYDFFLQLDGTVSFQKILNKYDRESKKKIIDFLENDIFWFFVDCFELQQMRPLNWDFRVKAAINDFSLPLNTIHFHVTGQCNLKCKHCYHTDFLESKNMSKEKVFELIDIFDKENISYVYFSGGEPLLNKNLLTYFERLSEKGIPYGFITNMTLMSEEFISAVKEIGYCKEINTSLDGPTQEIHDSYRASQGSFNKSLKWIPKIIDSGISLNLNSSIHREWLNNLEQWVPLIENLGIESWRTEYPANEGFFEKNKSEYSLSHLELYQLYNDMYAIIENTNLKSQLKSYSIGRHIKSNDLNHLLRYSSEDPICKQHIDILWLESDGTVPYCSLFYNKFPTYGNLIKDNLTDVWNAISNYRLDNRLGKLSCSSCNNLKLCGGGCPGTWSKPSDLIGCDEENNFIFSTQQYIKTTANIGIAASGA